MIRKNIHTLLSTIKVKIAVNGAANEKISKWRRIVLRSTPSDIRNETRPNDAGAYYLKKKDFKNKSSMFFKALLYEVL